MCLLILTPLSPAHMFCPILEVDECVSVIFRACFFPLLHPVHSRRPVRWWDVERGLPNERGPKARLCNRHSALLHKRTFYKSPKTSAIVTHASVGPGLALTRQHTHSQCAFHGWYSQTEHVWVCNLLFEAVPRVRCSCHSREYILICCNLLI